MINVLVWCSCWCVNSGLPLYLTAQYISSLLEDSSWDAAQGKLIYLTLFGSSNSRCLLPHLGSKMFDKRCSYLKRCSLISLKSLFISPPASISVIVSPQMFLAFDV